MFPGLWQDWQFICRIGRTSLLKVTDPDSPAALPNAAANRARQDRNFIRCLRNDFSLSLLAEPIKVKAAARTCRRPPWDFSPACRALAGPGGPVRTRASAPQETKHQVGRVP